MSHTGLEDDAARPLDEQVRRISRRPRSSPVGTADSASAQARRRTALFGLLDRRERWSLSWPGRLLVASLFLLLAGFVLTNIYPFLATTQRVDADVLVVEGWVHEYAIAVAVKEFRTGAYERVFTTGGPVIGIGGYINDFQTSASVAADLLKKAGLADESLQMVPSHTIGRDRTFSSAIALRDWLRQHEVSARALNIVTETTHARRTRLLFQKAFGNDVQIGIIAAANPDYAAARWWRYSEGVRDVVSESAAYLYARLVFALSIFGTTPGLSRHGAAPNLIGLAEQQAIGRKSPPPISANCSDSI